MKTVYILLFLVHTTKLPTDHGMFHVVGIYASMPRCEQRKVETFANPANKRRDGTWAGFYNVIASCVPVDPTDSEIDLRPFIRTSGVVCSPIA